jgi:imidazolonepropionase-like amidohydrolase
MTLFLLSTLLASAQDYSLVMRGLVVGAEIWTLGHDRVEFHTRFEFVREVDLKGAVTFEDGRVRSLLVAGAGYPWQPKDSPFPVGVLAVRARDWEREGRPAGNIQSCGERCYALEGFTWGRSFIWVDGDGALDRAFVPTAFAPLVALPRGRESRYPLVLEEAARVGLDSITPRVEAKPLAIVGADVLDVKTGAMHEDATVLIRGGRIESMGYATLPIPEDAERLDARGLTLLPGLWDMHAHLKQVEWLPAYLASCVTTVRDLGNETEFLVTLREGLAARPATGPRVLAAGFIDATPAEGAPYTSVVADSPEQGRARVRQYQAAGFDSIKVWSNVSGEALSAIANEAHSLGLEVTGHVPLSLTLEDAIARGLDQVDHVGYVTDALSRGNVLETLRTKRIVVDPTLVVNRYATRPQTSPLASYEPCAEWMPKELVDMWSAFGVAPEEAAAAETSFERSLETVRRLHDGGVQIVAGSDQGLPGCTLLLEIELYVRAGIGNLDAIRAATLVPARVMGLDGELGAIAPGMRADLILVDGNPLKDIRSLRYLRRVIRDGVALDPWELRRLADLSPP